MKYIVFILFTLMVAHAAGAADKIPVYVSIAPQKYFVQQIGKDRVDVHIMVHPGASPATYEPRPRQMAGVSTARAYFAVGVPFETKWLKKIAESNPRMKVVHTDHGVQKRPMAASRHLGEGGDADRHDGPGHAGDDHHHAEGGLDPHIWLSPPLVKIQARNILSALQEIDPSHRGQYEKNYHRFLHDIDVLDTRLRKTLAHGKGLRFLMFHPSWGYFARTYGMKAVSVEVEGKEPKPSQLKALIEHARDEGIKVIFVQPQNSTRSARLIAREIGGQVAVADPLAEDWMANLLEVAAKFKAALK